MMLPYIAFFQGNVSWPGVREPLGVRKDPPGVSRILENSSLVLYKLARNNFAEG